MKSGKSILWVSNAPQLPSGFGRQTETLYGMFVQPNMISPKVNDVIFGIHTATSGALNNLFHHSRAAAMNLYCSPSYINNVRAEISNIKKKTAISLDTISNINPENVNAWLDVGGDVRRPHYFRRQVGGNYPIAIVEHSVSYGFLNHDWVLPLLLGDVRAHDTIICTSPSAKKVMENALSFVAEDLNAEHGTRFHYNGRLATIPLGVDTSFFQATSKTEARKLFSLPQDATVLLWVGRISAQDKADLAPLLTVFYDLVKEHPNKNLHLVLAGSIRGDEGATLSRISSELQILNRVHALGAFKYENTAKLYSAADIFVSPVDSVQETFGITVVEAMSCGLPVVCSDWGGYRDSVIDNKTGILIPTASCGDDTVAANLGEWALQNGELLDQFACAQSTALNLGILKQTLTTLIINTELRRVFGDNGRKRAVETFDWKVIVKQYDDLMDDLRQTPCQKNTKRPYNRPRFVETFSHYPTHVLDDYTKIEISRKGPVIDPRPLMGVVSQTVAANIYDFITSVHLPVRVGDVVRAFDLPPSQTRFHVAWLLKHGYLKISS